MIPTQLKYLDFCRIKKKSKAPFEKDWVNKIYSYEEISKFYPGENYGVICGHHNLAVIDCDRDELKLAVEQLLPETFSVKTGGGGTHFYYFIPELKKKIILDVDDEHMGEIQSYGSQVVGVGSIHPNGKEYEIINNVGIKELTLKELENVLGNFMKKQQFVFEGKEDIKDYEKLVSEIVKVWKEGDRQELALSVSGYLRKEKRLGINKVKQIIKEVCEITDDEELEMRLRSVDETFKKDEKNIKGFTGLKKVRVSEIFTRRGQAEKYVESNPLYYDENKIWWAWNHNKFLYEISDETNILNGIFKELNIDTINSKTKIEIITALQQVSRNYKPKECKESWIQFENKIYDIETGEELESTSEYFNTSSIPYKFGKTEETPEIDKLFISWVGEEHKEELYEILAFCIVPSYFIHRAFVLIGSGANGKSTFLKILGKFIGSGNITSTSLDLLMGERFEGSKLLNKLVCLMGETNFNIFNRTGFFKSLTGEDLIRCEFKGKDVFDFTNRAKLIMATNSLPPTADKTEGFYRRWKIMRFVNKFKKEKDMLSKIPEKEFENLALKCFNISKRLWVDRCFTNEGDFDERKKTYEEESNPLGKFLKENYKKNVNSEVLFSDFFEGITIYLEERGARSLSAPAVSKQLKNEGYEIKILTKNSVNAKFILGLELPKLPELPNTLLSPTLGKESEHDNLDNLDNSQRELDKTEVEKIK